MKENCFQVPGQFLNELSLQHFSEQVLGSVALLSHLYHHF